MATTTVPGDAPGYILYGASPLSVFLAAVERTLNEQDPPAYIPPETWWRWLPPTERFGLAQQYVQEVERAEEPAEMHGSIPWAALAGYLGV